MALVDAFFIINAIETTECRRLKTQAPMRRKYTKGARLTAVTSPRKVCVHSRLCNYVSFDGAICKKCEPSPG
eukprot:1180804-Prorocentrum_minimum.AAC.4